MNNLRPNLLCKSIMEDLFMRRVIPANKVSHDYEKVLSEFVSALKNRFLHDKIQNFLEF